MADDYVVAGGKVVEFHVLVRASSKDDALKKAKEGDILFSEILCEYDHQFSEVLTEYEYLERQKELDNDKESHDEKS